MLVVLVFTQRQISNGVVDFFNEVTAVDAQSDPEPPPLEGSGEQSARPHSEPVSVQFYEPVALSVELARNRRMIATERARAAATPSSNDQQTP